MNRKNISANKSSPLRKPAGKGWYGVEQSGNFNIQPPPAKSDKNQPALQDTKLVIY